MSLKYVKCDTCGAQVVNLKSIHTNLEVPCEPVSVYGGGTQMTGAHIHKPDQLFQEGRHKLHVCPENKPKRKHRSRKTFAATLPQLDLEYPEVPEESKQKDPQ